MLDKDTFRLRDIILIESSFRRTGIVNSNDPHFVSKIDIGIEAAQHEGLLGVVLRVDFEAGSEEKPQQIASSIKMAGNFECPENNTSALSIEKFQIINAPAIIFPFIREHLASLSLKAGVGQILLAPINFVKFAEDNKK